MQPTAGFNNRSSARGFTFVEVLVAILILMISMLGILEAMVVAVQQNLETFSRDESVRIAEQAMNEARNTPMADLNNTAYDVTRTYRQFTRTFTVNRTITTLSSTSRSVQLDVSWTINNKVHTHSITSIISTGA